MFLVFQLKKSRLLLELPKINTAEEIVDVDSRTYPMVDFSDVYDSKEYQELATRTETAAKQVIEKDRENRKTNFTF